MSRKRLAWTVAASLAGLFLLLVVAAVLTIRSPWFYDKLRAFTVNTVETATGGRVEIGSFQFDWKRLRIEIRSIALHGREPADRPPLFRASSIAVGLKIVSLVKRDVDIQYLEVADPRVYLMIYPGGGTNVPEPKVKGNGRPVVETLLDLAIGRFDLRNGVFEVEARGETPFDARGQNLNLKLLYDLAGPRYRGDLSIQPLDLHLPDNPTQPFALAIALTLEKNRIDIASAKLSSGASRMEFSGAVEDLLSPKGTFRFAASVSVPDVARIAKIAELKRGTVEITGNATWSGGSAYSAAGKLHGYNIEFRDSTVGLRDFRLDGALTAGPRGVDLTGATISGGVGGPGECRAQPGREVQLWPCPTPANGRLAMVALRGRDLQIRGIDLGLVGGAFRGEAHLRDLTHYTVDGEIENFEIRHTVSIFDTERLPWDGRASGPVRVEGSFREKTELRASGDLTVGPAPGGAPVNGHVTAVYEARTNMVDVGRSTLTLPSTHTDFSGRVAALPAVQSQQELRVHLETRDLGDILPALGENPAEFPAKLANGTAIFDGTVTGDLSEPQIAGHLGVSRFSYEDRIFDSLQADVKASPAAMDARNATITQGKLSAQFEGTLGLHQWKIEDSNPIFGKGTVHDADAVALVMTLAALESPATGLVSGTAQFSGSLGAPVIVGDLDVTKGVFQEQPFDRFTAHVNYHGHTLEITQGQIAAGSSRVEISGTFDHSPNRFDEGQVRFRVGTNTMQLDQLQAVSKLRPGAKGTVQVSANGELNLTTSRDGKTSFRIADLTADLAARELELDGQALGDAHVTANTQNGVLHAQLESNFANSAIRGQGQWRLEGNYPGSATISFSAIDFARLRGWISPGQTSADTVTGSAEGELRIDGPVLQMDAIKVEARVPKFEITATAPVEGGDPSNANKFSLANSGPLVASLANNVVTIDSARFVGRATDLTVSGKVLLDQKSPLDLRVNGRLDLAIVQEFNHDFVSSGTVVAEATLRGAFDSPQMAGRLQLQNAAFSLADFPNGISNANGVILLTNEQRGKTRENRGTIQSFTGETGGGKIQLTGFGAYTDGAAVFQLHAAADAVRVRYPEGVSTVANASLDLTGTTARSQLSGTVTILRTAFNLQSDFSSVIAKSAEPVRTPATQTGILGGLNFDVQIETSPDIQFQSSLTEDLQMEANLRVRGTFSNPAVVGRVNVTQGQMVFYGTKYNINQGSIAFYNPLKVEPILDVDLETKAYGIDITLTVAGPLNKLHLTPRSDPPLQFNEIVALLATGRSPTSDPTMLTEQSTTPQSFQQMGASTLLGQAIANPVAGRLQRFFGVSKLRIDPTIAGVENNPQARLTLEQEITPSITFTYITNVTSANPQVVRMEWAFSKQWSAVALRDENGTFGLDFFYKKRF